MQAGSKSLSNLDMFVETSTEVMPTIAELVEQAIGILLSLFRKGIPMAVSFSGGKDSATCSSLTLLAALRARAEGLKPLVIVSTSNTLVENPEIENHYYTELRKMAEFGKRHGIKVVTKVVTPTLASTFQIKILTGRGMPSFAGTNTDCSEDLKQKPQIAWRNRFFDSLQERGLPEPVTILGTRYDESEKRRIKMLGRNESATDPVRNKSGDLVLSPLAWWTEDDIWEFLGEAAKETFGPTYSDFEETRRIYAHSSGTSCAVVADALSSGKPARGGCGARHGCWLCLQAEDKSMENMLEYDERYAYMRSLFHLNKFIRATRYDWNRRNWIGRPILGGYIKIEPDTYHPSMIRELTRYMLQIDFDEEQRARRAGEEPKFQILAPETLIALDALWSLHGLAIPFAVWKDWREIRSGMVRYDVPTIDELPQAIMPAPKFLYVGTDWDDTAPSATWTGMRDPIIEGLLGENPVLKTLDNGRTVWNIKTERMFDVDVEGAAMLLDFELERMIEMANRPRISGGITAGYKFYLTYGVLTLSYSQLSAHDDVLRRTAFKDRNGLTLEYDVKALRDRAIWFKDLPDAARKAWAKEGTTQTAQLDLELLAA